MLMDEIDAHKRTDAALQKAKEVAEAANVAKTRYIVGISHEIRTPLNSIFGYAQLLERGTAGPSDNAIRVIRRSAEHLDESHRRPARHLQDRERHAAPEPRQGAAGRSSSTRSSTCSACRPRPRASSSATQRPPHLPAYVHTDQKRLRQILINLLSNAIKYTERGNASADGALSQPGGGVRDLGHRRRHPGRTNSSACSSPSSAARAPNVRAIPGTGLGLTITKLLTQIMGGEISCAAAPRAGHHLHRAAAAVRSEAGAHLQAYRAARARSRLRRARAAGCCSSTTMRRTSTSCRACCAPLDFTLFTAPDGATGLELAAECRPDLAMIDISMPGMTGWQVAEQLRAIAGPRSAEDRHRVGQCARVQRRAAPAPRTMPSSSSPSTCSACSSAWRRSSACSGCTSRGRRARQRDAGRSPRCPRHSRHHVDDLYQLGLIGHVRGIQAKLREMEATIPANKPFADPHARAGRELRSQALHERAGRRCANMANEQCTCGATRVLVVDDTPETLGLSHRHARPCRLHRAHRHRRRERAASCSTRSRRTWCSWTP